MIILSWWEEFIIGAAMSFLTVLSAKITNPTELAALQASLAFLTKLMSGTVKLASKTIASQAAPVQLNV